MNAKSYGTVGHGPTYFYDNTVDHRHEDIGWRPVLEEVL
jgi:hypothetical protein